MSFLRGPAWALLGALCGSCNCEVVQAQTFHPWRHITSRNGLPQNSIIHLAMDPLAYLWITTEGGMVRYDGRSFLPFQMPVGKGALSPRMRQLMPTAAGELLADDARGNLYLVHDHVVAFRIRGEGARFQQRGMLPSADLYLRMLDTSRALPGIDEWTMLPATILAFNAAEWAVLGKDQLLLYTDTVLTGRIELPRGARELVLINDRIYGSDGLGRPFRVDIPHRKVAPIELHGLGNANRPTWTIHWQSGDPYFLVLTVDSLYIVRPALDGDDLIAELVDVRLPVNTRVGQVIFMEREELLAIATSTDGLHLFRRKPFRTMTCGNEQGMDNAFYAHIELAPGTVLATDYDRRGMLLDDAGCRRAQAPFDTLSMISIVRDARDRIWGSQIGQAFCYEPVSGTTRFLTPKRMGATMFMPEGDSVWLANKDRLGVVARDSLRWLATLGGDDERDRPLTMTRDAQGRFWYGCCTGLYRADDASCTRFTAVPVFAGHCVRTLEVVDDLLFIGTYGAGAFVKKGERIVKIPPDRDGYLTYSHAFLRDGRDHLWISTNRGLVRTTLADVRTFLADSTNGPYLATYDEWSGMRSSELNGGCSPAYIRLTDGRVSFPSLSGLVQFVPEEVPDPYPYGHLLVEDILVDGSRWPVDEQRIFPSDVDEVVIGISMPYWGDPVNALLEYRITGIHEEWRPLAHDQQRILIERPPAGEHELHIRKVGSAARNNNTPEVLWFRVRSPFHRTWPAYALFAIGTALLVVLLIKVNSLRLRRRNRWLEQSVARQTDALLKANTELRRALDHQETLVSITSHDVVTPLRFIDRVAHGAVEMHRSGRVGDELGDTLKDLSGSTGKLHASARNLLDWTRQQGGRMISRPQRLALRPFIEETFDRVKEMSASKGLALINGVGSGDAVHADPDLLHIILNNILMNALVHTTSDRIEVDGAVETSGYRLVVRDRGQGMSPGVLERIRRQLRGQNGGAGAGLPGGPATGLGYVIIGECAKAMRAQVEVESGGTGTSLTLYFPWPQTT